MTSGRYFFKRRDTHFYGLFMTRVVWRKKEGKNHPLFSSLMHSKQLTSTAMIKVCVEKKRRIKRLTMFLVILLHLHPFSRFKSDTLSLSFLLVSSRTSKNPFWIWRDFYRIWSCRKRTTGWKRMFKKFHWSKVPEGFSLFSRLSSLFGIRYWFFQSHSCSG